MENYAMLNFYKSILRYKHSIPPSGFSHLQGGGWILQDITKVYEQMHRHKMLILIMYGI
jgi:hypothetical protein